MENVGLSSRVFRICYNPLKVRLIRYGVIINFICTPNNYTVQEDFYTFMWIKQELLAHLTGN